MILFFFFISKLLTKRSEEGEPTLVSRVVCIHIRAAGIIYKRELRQVQMKDVKLASEETRRGGLA